MKRLNMNALDSIPSNPPFDYLSLPIPPPWKKMFPTEGASGTVYYDEEGSSKPQYINDVTGVICAEHPMQTLWARILKQHEISVNESNLTNNNDETGKSAGVDIEVPSSFGASDIIIPAPFSVEIDPTQLSSSHKKMETPFVDFRCSWKECGLFGGV